MTMDAQKDQLVTDQFSVFNVDGYTKVTGLTDPADFSVTIWRDGVVQAAYSYTIAEIGSSGEYKFAFTPDAVGHWEAEVAVAAYHERWAGSYQVTDYLVADLHVLLELVAGAIGRNAVVRDILYDGHNQKEGYVDIYATEAEADDAYNEVGSPSPVATIKMEGDWFAPGKATKIKRTLEGS